MKIRDRIATAMGALQGKMALVPQKVTAGSLYENSPAWEYQTHQIAYGVHPWVYACARVIATNGAIADLQMHRRRTYNDDGRPLTIKEPIPDHPMNDLFRIPNEQMSLSAYALLNLTLGFLELNGNAYWYLARDPDTGIAHTITPLRPDRVRPVPDRQKFILGYIYTVDGDTFKLNDEDVVHFKYFNPYNDYLGQSTLSAARTTLTEDTLAKKYNIGFFRRGSRPGGALAFDHQLDDDDYTRLRAEWRKGHEGVENAHNIAILERGAKWQSIGISQKDADFIQSRKLNREEMAGVFGVPPVLINSYEHANYNTAKTQLQLFWRTTMQTKLTLIRETINASRRKFMGALAEQVRTEDTFADWDMTQVWAAIEETIELMETASKAVNNGIMNRNEARAKFFNLAPIVGGEKFFRAAGQTNIAEDTDPEDEDPEDEEEPEEEVEEDEEQEEEPEEKPEEEDDDARALRKEQRLNQWKAAMVTTDFLEEKFKKFVLAIFKDQERAVIARLRASLKRLPKTVIEVESVLFDLPRAQQAVEKATGPLHERMLREGGRRGMLLATTGVVFGLDNPRAQRILREKAQKFAREINATTWNKLKDSLVDGIAKGDGIVEMQSRVRDVMGTRRGKSLDIARTEVLGTYNGGINEAFNQAGEVVKGKEWLTAGDGEVRESHEDLDGVKIPTNDVFEVQEGAGLQFPGDPSGASSEIINCRCTLMPVLEEL